jgi:hypothetical protein
MQKITSNSDINTFSKDLLIAIITTTVVGICICEAYGWSSQHRVCIVRLAWHSNIT